MGNAYPAIIMICIRLLDSPDGGTGPDGCGPGAGLRPACAGGNVFFNRAAYDLRHSAKPGSFALLPRDGMTDVIRSDYEKMSGMIFGGVRPRLIG